MTESNWHIFKREFEKEHPDFYQMLLFEYKEIIGIVVSYLLAIIIVILQCFIKCDDTTNNDD